MSKSEGCYSNLLISFNERRRIIMANENKSLTQQEMELVESMFTKNSALEKAEAEKKAMDEYIYKNFILPKTLIS